MRFRLAVLGFLAAFYFYLSWSLFWPLSALGRVVGAVALAGVFLKIAWVPLVYWQQDARPTSAGERGLLWAVFSSMGLISFVFVICVLRDLASLVVSTPLRTPVGTAVILIAALLLFTGGYLSAHWVRLRTVQVPWPLPEGGEPLRVVQISDLHVGPTIRRDFVAKVARIIREAKPDVIVLTGDLVDGIPTELVPELAPLSDLPAPGGRFYVTGNHEYYWDGSGWLREFARLGFRPLVNETVTIDHPRSNWRASFTGLPDPAAAADPQCERPDLQRAAASRAGPSRGDASSAERILNVLLVHQPGIAERAAPLGFDLQLSGHTHGGQFFPWTLIADRVHRFNHGLGRMGQMWVYVSRGTGYWGPPVRLGAPPEVTLLVIGA